MNSRSNSKGFDALVNHSIRKNQSEFQIIKEENSGVYSLSKQIQAQQKQDPQQDLTILKEITDFLSSRNVYPFGENPDIRELKTQFKSAKLSLNSLLHAVSSQVDPLLDIKTFQDEKLQLLMKKFSHPCKISKTRMISLGSSHTLSQSLQIIRWVASIGEAMYLTVPEEQNEDSFDDIFERAILQEHLKEKQRPDFILSQLEDTKQQYREKLSQIKQQQQMLNDQLQREKISQPKIKILEQEIQSYQQKIQDLNADILNIDTEQKQMHREYERINQQTNDKINEINQINQQIEQLKQQIESQPMTFLKAQDLIHQTNQYNHQIKIFMEQQEKIQAENSDTQMKSQDLKNRIEQIVIESNQLIERLNIEFQEKLPTLVFNFNLFEQIPKYLLFKEAKNGISDIEDSDNLFDDLNFDGLEFKQKILEDKQLLKRRKSVQISDSIMKRDVKQTVALILPEAQRKLIKERSLKQSEYLNNQIYKLNNELQDMKTQWNQQNHRYEDLKQQKLDQERKILELQTAEQDSEAIRKANLEFTEQMNIQEQEAQSLKQEIKSLNDTLEKEKAYLEELNLKHLEYEQLYSRKLLEYESREQEMERVIQGLHTSMIDLLEGYGNRIEQINQKYCRVIDSKPL